MTKSLEQYETAIAEVLQLARKINFNEDELEFQKIDVGQNEKRPKCQTNVDEDQVRLSCISSILMIVFSITKRFNNDHEKHRPTRLRKKIIEI